MEELGKVDFEKEKEKRNKPVFVPSWFTVDLKTGVSLLLSFDVMTFFSLKIIVIFKKDFKNETLISM